MSENWLFLLITAYVVFLLGSFFKFSTLLAEELKMFGWYFAVGLLAAISLTGPADNCQDCEINLFGMFRKMWHDVIFPFALAFISFSVPRLLIVIFQDWRKRKQREQHTT